LPPPAAAGKRHRLQAERAVSGRATDPGTGSRDVNGRSTGAAPVPLLLRRPCGGCRPDRGGRQPRPPPATPERPGRRPV